MNQGKTIAWGEIINAIRNLHVQFFQKFPYEFKDISLNTAFVFPPSTGNLQEWEPLDIHENLSENLAVAIELNAVERTLLEGTLSPFEVISINQESEVAFILKQILMLEREWLAKMNFTKPEAQEYIEKALLRLQNQWTGKRFLRAV